LPSGVQTITVPYHEKKKEALRKDRSTFVGWSIVPAKCTIQSPGKKSTIRFLITTVVSRNILDDVKPI
jgi:hypothetical protein